jgi:hypothetical protein
MEEYPADRKFFELFYVPGLRYLIVCAFRSAWSVSSTVMSTLVSTAQGTATRYRQRHGGHGDVVGRFV